MLRTNCLRFTQNINVSIPQFSDKHFHVSSYSCQIAFFENPIVLYLAFDFKIIHQFSPKTEQMRIIYPIRSVIFLWYRVDVGWKKKNLKNRELSDTGTLLNVNGVITLCKYRLLIIIKKAGSSPSQHCDLLDVVWYLQCQFAILVYCNTLKDIDDVFRVHVSTFAKENKSSAGTALQSHQRYFEVSCSSTYDSMGFRLSRDC